jgi:hypothetical protein
MRARRTALVAALALAGCTTPPSAAELAGNAAQKYVNALAAGYYRSACTLLDGRTRASLGGADGCRKVLSRCLPYNAQVAKRDQSQLLYATVDVKVKHSRAQAALSGTAVARAVKSVTLARENGHWLLTSYGSAITGCVSRVKAKLIGS